MKSRGLTLIEMLMALALMAALVSGGAAWLSTTVRVSERLGALREEAAIDSLFTRIHEDLLTGDFEPREASSRGKPRIREVDRSLEIDTRDGITHVYRVVRGTDSQQALVREERDHGSTTVRRLLTDVQAFSCVIDDERQWLDITIASHSMTAGLGGEQSIQRRYRLR